MWYVNYYVTKHNSILNDKLKNVFDAYYIVY